MVDNRQINQVVLYARVSTRESADRQHVENQLRELRDFCGKQGWEVVGEYIDHESGTKADREQFKLLFTHAHQRQFDAVVFWALDRFSREGVRETLNHLNRLESAGVSFFSFTEPHVNSLGAWRDAVLGFTRLSPNKSRCGDLSASRQVWNERGQAVSTWDGNGLPATSGSKLKRCLLLE